jgi:DNA-directed RNA polymerase specialized sigma24 family protein
MSRVPVSRQVDERAGAIERIYEQRYAGFRRAVSSIVGDHDRAHDAVQEGFARALAKRDSYRGGSLEAWVWRIVLRKAFDLRPGSREVPLEFAFDPGLIPGEPDPELGAAIAALPARRRLVVFLRYFGDLSYEQIGEVCGISAGTVAASLSQAHDELRRALDLEGAER